MYVRALGSTDSADQEKATHWGLTLGQVRRMQLACGPDLDWGKAEDVNYCRSKTDTIGGIPTQYVVIGGAALAGVLILTLALR